MRLGDSIIVRTMLGRLLPFILLFGAMVFSYGAVFPGGGFQSGVIVGTLLVVIDMALETRLRSDLWFARLELAALLLIGTMVAISLVLTGRPLAGVWTLRFPAPPLANPIFWLLSGAIAVEVAASMVLIFRKFVYGQDIQGKKVRLPKINERSTSKKTVIDWNTGTISAVLIFGTMVLLVLAPGLRILDLPLPRPVQYNWQGLAESLGIKNLVTAVYLGPRVSDTLMEIMVVTLTVLGMKALDPLPEAGRGH